MSEAVDTERMRMQAEARLSLTRQVVAQVTAGTLVEAMYAEQAIDANVKVLALLDEIDKLRIEVRAWRDQDREGVRE